MFNVLKSNTEKVPEVYLNCIGANIPNNKIILLPLLVVARIACDRIFVLPTLLMCVSR